MERVERAVFEGVAIVECLLAERSDDGESCAAGGDAVTAKATSGIAVADVILSELEVCGSAGRHGGGDDA